MEYHDAAVGRPTDLPELLLGGDPLTLLAGVCQTDVPKISSDWMSTFCTNQNENTFVTETTTTFIFSWL